MIQDDKFWSTEKLLPKKKRPSPSYGGVSLAFLREEQVLGEECLHQRSYPQLRSLYAAQVYSVGGASAASEGFLRDARRALSQKADPVKPYCSYFSYAPCYRELSALQLNSYLVFCEDVKARRCRKVDYSYLALYVYTLLNLADAANARATLETLLWIWGNYRESFAVLDKLLADWVTDLCVEWDLPFPFGALDGILVHTHSVSSPVLHTLYLFDYLLSGEFYPRGAQVEYMMRCLCDYRYRSVSLYRDNALYAASMDGFLAYLFEEGFLSLSSQREEFLSLKIPTRVTLKRSSYPGAVMDGSRRRSLAYDYCPLLGDVNVKSRFTSLVKYVDNRIRRRMGMKIKFSSVSIAPVHRQFIDLRFEAYFATRLRSEEALEKAPALPVKKRELQVDLAKASAIESESWKTTDCLTKDLYSGEEMIAVGEEKSTPSVLAPTEFVYGDTQEDVTEFCASLDLLETEFLVFSVHTSCEQAKAFARSKGQFYDNLLRRVNQKALEFLEDVVIEPSGTIIEDYREQLEFLLPKDQYLPPQG